MNHYLPIDPDWFDIAPYSLTQVEKRAFFTKRMKELTSIHYQNCKEYKSILDSVFHISDISTLNTLEEMPFLPVSLFKTHSLHSVEQSNIVKILTSSGTTGQTVSRIFLDAKTAKAQEHALVRIMQHFLGKARLPMVILDHKNVIRDRDSFSARGAGILGMSQFGRNPFYALNEDLQLDYDGLVNYLEKAGEQKIFFFGFTFMVWIGLIQALEKNEKKLSLRNAILIHSGGWKKLTAQAVSPNEFRERLLNVTGIQTCLNFYGMVEQVGGVFVENAQHYFQTPIFSEVIIRDPFTLEPLPNGQPGLIQVLSILPESYPGHSILTEDFGIIHGIDDNQSNMKGRYFEVLGRVPKAELRGCSDTVS